MKSKDLRIGNLIIDEAFPTLISTVESIGINTIYSSYDDDKHISFFKPIPLTEEWLVNNTEFRPFVGWDDMIFWRLPNWKENDFELLETALGYMTPNDAVVKCVHTLQNCYYFHALTNEELTIKI